jgi:hypothetical protein
MDLTGIIGRTIVTTIGVTIIGAITGKHWWAASENARSIAPGVLIGFKRSPHRTRKQRAVSGRVDFLQRRGEVCFAIALELLLGSLEVRNTRGDVVSL